jgi:hypothetical protein
MKMRTDAVEKLNAIVGSDKDPLAVVIAMACDENLDNQTRLGACSIALPYLYPRLSSTQVSSNITVSQVDPTKLLDRIAERIARLNPPAPTVEGEVVEPADPVTA